MSIFYSRNNMVSFNLHAWTLISSVQLFQDWKSSYSLSILHICIVVHNDSYNGLLRIICYLHRSSNIVLISECSINNDVIFGRSMSYGLATMVSLFIDISSPHDLIFKYVWNKRWLRYVNIKFWKSPRVFKKYLQIHLYPLI